MPLESKDEVHFGFLLIPLQALDMVGPMDILSNITHEMVEQYVHVVVPKPYDIDPEALKKRAPNFKFHHIGPSSAPVLTTANFHATPTCTVDNCPPLDYLLVGGPNPEYALKVGQEGGMPEEVKRFIQARAKECKTVFATCTGALVLAATGILDDKPATVNHSLEALARARWPAVKWDFDHNWVVSDNGKFWTAGGAVAGMDMTAEWVKQMVGEELLGLSTMLLDYQPRDVLGKPIGYINGRGEKITVT